MSGSLAPSGSRKAGWFLRLARPYVRSRLRGNFAEVSVAGLEATRSVLVQRPLLVAPNHVSWWDPLLCVALDEQLGGGGHCLMDAANLRRFPFFSWVGALPLERSSPRLARDDLERALNASRRAGEFLIVFPQGEQRPSHLPLVFHAGVSWLAARGKLATVPVGVRYQFGEGPRPRIFVSFGPPLEDPGSSNFLARLEGAVARELERIDAELLRRLSPHSLGSEFRALFGHADELELPLGTSILTGLARRGGQGT
ncbi:MAG TPA: lysophospholipid acyltransferase family protein [Polyangiaceae bacterium]|nr:lysophospholipid acyltransferase family protein [Polyangiaceae bacterium]